MVRVKQVVTFLAIVAPCLGIFRCPNRNEDKFYRDPENCAVFYRCHQGGKDTFTCGPGTVFNTDTDNCDWPHIVKCDQRSRYGEYPSASTNQQSVLPKPNWANQPVVPNKPNPYVRGQDGLGQQPVPFEKPRVPGRSDPSSNPTSNPRQSTNAQSRHNDGLVIDHPSSGAANPKVQPGSNVPKGQQNQYPGNHPQANTWPQQFPNFQNLPSYPQPQHTPYEDPVHPWTLGQNPYPHLGSPNPHGRGPIVMGGTPPEWHPNPGLPPRFGDRIPPDQGVPNVQNPNLGAPSQFGQNPHRGGQASIGPLARNPQESTGRRQPNYGLEPERNIPQNRNPNPYGDKPVGGYNPQNQLGNPALKTENPQRYGEVPNYHQGGKPNPTGAPGEGSQFPSASGSRRPSSGQPTDGHSKTNEQTGRRQPNYGPEPERDIPQNPNPNPYGDKPQNQLGNPTHTTENPQRYGEVPNYHQGGKQNPTGAPGEGSQFSSASGPRRPSSGQPTDGHSKTNQQKPNSWDLLRNKTLEHMNKPNRPDQGNTYDQDPYSRSPRINPDQGKVNPYGKTNPRPESNENNPSPYLPKANTDRYNNPESSGKLNPHSGDPNRNPQSTDDDLQQKHTVPRFNPRDRVATPERQPHEWGQAATRKPIHEQKGQDTRPEFQISKPTYPNQSFPGSSNPSWTQWTPSGQQQTPNYYKPTSRYPDHRRPESEEYPEHQTFVTPATKHYRPFEEKGGNQPDYIERTPEESQQIPGKLNPHSKPRCREKSQSSNPQNYPNNRFQSPTVIHSSLNDCIEETPTGQPQNPNSKAQNPYFDPVTHPQQPGSKSANDYYFPQRRGQNPPSDLRQSNAYTPSPDRDIQPNYEPQWYRPQFQFASQVKPNASSTVPSNTRGRPYETRPVYNPTAKGQASNRNNDESLGSYNPRIQWRPRAKSQIPNYEPTNRQTETREEPKGRNDFWSSQTQQKEEPEYASSNNEPIHVEDFETAESVSRIVRSDPFAVRDLTRNLRCAEAGETNCTDCEFLNWLKFPKVLLKSEVMESVAFNSEGIEKSCHRRCTQLDCVAYSYSSQKGICIMFSSQVTPNDVVSADEYITVILKPSTAVIADEWLYTDPATPVGRPMAALRAENMTTCLHSCVAAGKRCAAVGFDKEAKYCKLYDQMNGKAIGLTSNSVVVQHRDMFEPDDQWRFTKFGKRHLNGTVPISTFAVSEPQECYQECLNTPGCLFVSLEGSNGQECHIYNRMSTYAEDGNFDSFILSVPLNASSQLELPQVYFTGSPMAMHENYDVETCLEAARRTPKAKKVTYLPDKKQCFLYSDSAIVSTWNRTEDESRSFLLTMPKELQDMSFKRLLGLNIYRPVGAPTGRITDEISASRCQDLCLQQDCFAVGVTYDVFGQNIDCNIYHEKDITSAPKLVYQNNTELFIRTLNKDAPLLSTANPVVRGQASKSTPKRHCAKVLYKMHASENLDVFNRADGVDNTIEQNTYGSPKSGRTATSTQTDHLMPHGDDYVGFPDDMPPSPSERSRKKRSIYGMTVHSTQTYLNMMKDPNVDPLAAGLMAAQASNQILKAILDEQANNKNENHLLQQFMRQIKIVSSNPNANDDFMSNMIDNVRNARRGSEEKVRCQVTRGSMARTVTCSPNEVCLDPPQIKFADSDKIGTCHDIKLNSSCPLVCRSGYKPSVDRVFCERVGSTSAWNTVSASCLPDLQSCTSLPWIPVKGDQGLVKEKLHYLVKYDHSKKLPVFSMYKHSPENGLERTSPSNENIPITPHPCPQLKGHQLSNINYKLTNYSKGHLTSPAAFQYSKEALVASNYIINTAPQDPFTKDGPWHVLNSRLINYLNRKPGFVVSGVCLKQIYLPLSSMLPVPSCFWKIICTQSPQGEVTAAAFFHPNTIPVSPADKKKRVEEVMSYTNQQFVRSLVGRDHYDSIWSEAFDYFNADKESTEALTVEKCKSAQSISSSSVQFWNDLLTNSNNGPSWPQEFENGVVSPDESQPSLARGRSAGALRRQRDVNCDKKVIAYVGNSGKKLAQKVISSSITHLIYGSVAVEANGSLSFTHPSQTYSKLYEMLQVRQARPDLKLLFSIGGWENSDYFSSIAASGLKQRNFIKDLLGLLTYWRFDGVDILWQYPVLGGKTNGNVNDRDNYVRFLRNIREAMAANEINAGSGSNVLTISAPGAYWILERGYDLNQISSIVDWINVMSFDYFGAWNSSWGAYTGPISPLYFGAPDGFPGKLNVDSTIKQYVCRVGDPEKIVLGIPFYGRYWENVGAPVFDGDDLYRSTEASPGLTSSGGVLTYEQIERDWLTDLEGSLILHQATRTTFLWNAKKKTMVSFENDYSVGEKVKYAGNHNLGGIFLWSLDFDDESGTLLNGATSNNLCLTKQGGTKIDFKCNPLQEKRWWTQYDGDGSNDRMCGQSAPLINGFYPICDPDDPGYSCCSDKGYCGSGPGFCECSNCTDYGKYPEKALIKPIKPNQDVRWHTAESRLGPSQPQCGHSAPRLTDGRVAICDPANDKAHCCSSAGYCGVGLNFCECIGCVDFRKNPSYTYSNKTWWDWNDGPEVAGRCGPKAPKMSGQSPTCNPDSSNSFCCGAIGYCGSGSHFCDCPACVNFQKNPFYKW